MKLRKLRLLRYGAMPAAVVILALAVIGGPRLLQARTTADQTKAADRTNAAPAPAATNITCQTPGVDCYPTTITLNWSASQGFYGTVSSPDLSCIAGRSVSVKKGNTTFTATTDNSGNYHTTLPTSSPNGTWTATVAEKVVTDYAGTTVICQQGSTSKTF